jgi:hypothetical protein
MALSAEAMPDGHLRPRALKAPKVMLLARKRRRGQAAKRASTSAWRLHGSINRNAPDDERASRPTASVADASVPRN